MALPMQPLDDRRFQDIVDQAKRMIPQFCPEWTDHNVSDPGVTLIELFAWMTDLLLYRVNQVPQRNYIKFLELIGLRLEPPRAARAPVTFYLSAPQAFDVVIPAETEVATVRTETSAATIFTTETDLTIRPAILTGAFTRSASTDTWTVHDLRQIGLPGRKIQMFPDQPAPGDAFYISLERDHSGHIMALTMACESAGGAGVDPTNPPYDWQVWQGDVTRWAKCVVETDETLALNQDGTIVLRFPAMAQSEINGVRGYWLRCRLNERQAGPESYRVSPDLERLTVESRGATVSARHAVTVMNEVLGRSDETPGQRFRLLNTPVLARDPARDYLEVELPDGRVEPWTEVPDFSDSKPDDRHYTLDSLDGTITLGPALLQPDGTVYRFGAIPPRNSILRFRRYQYGGGVAGNVLEGALSVLKTSIPYVARVWNWSPAVGGLNAQTLEDAMIRAPGYLRTRTRAVTADDYEYLATQVEGVARACCLGPQAQPGGAGAVPLGQVQVYVLPQLEAADGRIAPERLVLTPETQAAVKARLDERRVLGATLEVLAPRYLWVGVKARLRLAEHSTRAQAAEVAKRAEEALYRYLNPYVGGPRGDGWPFGRELHLSEIYGLLQRLQLVEFVEEVSMTVQDAPGGPSRPAPPRLTLPPAALICSSTHEVVVEAGRA